MDKQAKHPGAAGTGPEAHKKFAELVRSFDTALLVTNRADGTPHARPMAVADVTNEGDLWFITGADSAKVEEAASDGRALATMQGNASFLTVTGHAEIRNDPAKVKELWKENFRVWFDGPEDPIIRLMVLRAEQAEYWDNRGLSGVKYLIRAAAAYVTGQEIRGIDDPKIHGKVQM